MFCNRLQVTKVLKTKFEIAAVKKKNPLKDLQKNWRSVAQEYLVLKSWQESLTPGI